jgi:alkylmercury lyase
MVVDERLIDVAELAGSVAKASRVSGETEERVALAIYRGLAEGEPVRVDGLASEVGIPATEAEALLERWPGVFRDSQGRIVGFWGLTIEKLTPTHRIRLDGRDLFAWCAWDTLFLPGLIGKAARVESDCPTTGETISLEVGPDGVGDVSHPSAVVSFLRPEREFDADVIDSFCHFVLFFANEDAGARWVRDHEGTFLLSLEEAFELGRLVNEQNFPSTIGAA